MRPRLQLWLMRLPLWRWLARVFARPSHDELEQYRDAKARAEFGVFRPYRPDLDEDEELHRKAIARLAGKSRAVDVELDDLDDDRRPPPAP